MQNLIPFEPEIDSLMLKGDLEFRNKSDLMIKFQLFDPATRVLRPSVDVCYLKEALERKYDLWKTTCFEAFLAEESSTKYFEINLSPWGAWDAYEFQDYRAPLPPKRTEGIQLNSLEWSGFQLEAHLSIKDKNSKWLCGLTAVIESKDEKRQYFALKHSGPKPDFHLRQSFSLRRSS